MIKVYWLVCNTVFTFVYRSKDIIWEYIISCCLFTNQKDHGKNANKTVSGESLSQRLKRKTMLWSKRHAINFYFANINWKN